jgi:hypothetical protein
MTDVEFMDCPYRFIIGDELHCKNKEDGGTCDNCTENVHLNCENYVPKNDMCLLFFELGVSDVSQYDECAEKIIYDDKKLQQKWSN